MIKRRYRLAACCGIILVLSGVMFDRWIAKAPMPALTPPVSQTVLDREGVLLRAYTVEDGLWRLPVSLVEVDEGYIRQLIAYEDKRFWHHGGVDPRALMRAGVSSLRAGRIVSGGSTLTMQVARLLENAPTRNVEAKLRQIRLALALERRLSKEEILTLYLTLAPFGGNIEGVRAASLSYFGKEPRHLSIGQAALLVALPQSPNARRPERFAQNATAARAQVLARSARRGVLSAAEADEAAREKLPDRRRSFPLRAPHLADRLTANTAGPVHLTTLDARVQTALEEMVRKKAEQMPAGHSMALLVVEHHSGAIVARVGSPGLRVKGRGGYLDLTRAVRSPGSTLKPLIYGLAFEQGLAHPETLIDDRPMSFAAYRPTNFDGVYHGTMSVREALQLSRNVPSVAVLEALGPARLLSAMRRAGAAPILPPEEAPGLAIALGGVGATLEDLVRIYASLARGGEAVPLHEVKGENSPAPKRLMGARAAWYIGDILAGVAPPDNAPERTLAFKTGTSYGNRDAWAVGFDGTHTIGVWVGRPDGGAAQGITGIDDAAPVLFTAFNHLKPQADPLSPLVQDALRVSNADLPAPLKRFKPRGLLRADTADPAPRIAFPPDGSVLALGFAGEEPMVPLKLRDGRAPFSVLINGRKIAVDPFAREHFVSPDGPGFVEISIVDAKGRSASAAIKLE